MGTCSGCVETVRNDKNIYLLDAKNRAGGPLTIIDTEEYDRRLEKVKAGDSDAMFDADVPTWEIFTDEERRSHVAHALAGLLDLDNMPDGAIVTAYEQPRDPEVAQLMAQ